MRISTRPYALPLACAVLLASAAAAEAQDRCDVRRELDERLDGAGIRGVLVHAESGRLEVVGGDAPAVTVRAVVCASDAERAEAARLVVEARREAAWIEADLPDADGWGRSYVRMDLVVEMPRSLAVDVEDGSGDILVRSVSATRIEDGSGALVVEDVDGAVSIEDGSGEVRVRNAGSVEIRDSSGEIDVEGVRGAVHVLEDGSGTIVIRQAGGDVRIDEDGSGSISVDGVGGDFVVDRDGSGTIEFREVRGTVRVPDRR